MKPVIFGLSGETLTSDERAFFKDAQPAGYILFGRNVASKEQVRALTDSLRDLHGDDQLPILVDQEGGRVARLKPPVWPEFPAGGVFDALYDISPIRAIQAARWNARALAKSLIEVGITVDCLPMVDVRAPGSSAVVGDRSLGDEPMKVAALGKAILDGLEAGGVGGTVKHMPGHGRAKVDSHHHLPIVDATAAELAVDLHPFQALRDATMGMTCHCVFPAWDADRPATMSPTVIANIIRGEIGFDGLLMSDDLDMNALQGDVPTRAVDCVAAGCDIALNCWGRMDDMVAIADRLPDISAASLTRLQRAKERLDLHADGPNLATLIAERDALLA